MRTSIFSAFLCFCLHGSADVTIVEAGKPRATIVAGEKPTPTERFAAEELQWHIEKMTGAKLDIAEKRSDGLLPIYIGRSASSVKLDAGELTPEHYRIVVRTDWIAIAGRDTSSSERVDDPLSIEVVQPGTLFGVYHLLDQVLGVRWLWPGEQGASVPQRRTLTIPAMNVTDGPKLVQRQLRHQRSRRRRQRTFGKTEGIGMADDAIANRLDKEERIWLRRHRMGRRARFAFGHAFTRWWGKYGKTHPEYFATLPNREQPFPNAERPKLCVSNSAVTDQIIADWKAGGATSHLAACPNDSRAYCTCANCRRWDLPVQTTPDDVDQSVLTYRYVKFWNVLAKQVAAINPEALVCGYAYSNYRSPPEGVKLEPNMILGYVGSMGEETEEEWTKWAAAGARLYFRPNWFHSGHNAFYMPLKEAGRFLRYAHQNSMLGTDFDSLLGHYSTQGPYYYLVARLHARPDLSVESIIQEYCDGFGPASELIREYIAYWEEHTIRYREAIRANSEKYRGGSRSALRLMPELFDDRTLGKAEKLLKEAARKIKEERQNLIHRIQFLQKGIEHVRLTRDAVRYGQDVGSVRGIRENALRAVNGAKALRSFRKSIENTFVDWTEYSDYKEITLGDYTGLRLASVMGARQPIHVMPGAWRFRFDPKKVGENEKWFGQNYSPRREKWDKAVIYRWWERNSVGEKWKEKHGKDYDGIGWYRTSFTPPKLPEDKRIKLLFGAVDEACKVWLNGKLAGEHPYINPDDWKTPFEFDVTDFLVQGENHITVRVEDNAGMGGIWKLVWLLAE
ncbi:MAG: DUF4838 domain-containing protein [Planctomycetota bacterium]|nr:DUF4838 domain-containing protein [Planctomycetota bacterium]